MAYIDVDDGAKKNRPVIQFALPFQTTLRGKQGEDLDVKLRRVFKEDEQRSASTPALAKETTRILDHVWHLLNYEIVERGDSYPFPAKALTRTQCLDYFGGGELFVLTATSSTGANIQQSSFTNPTTGAHYEFGSDILGCFYIKPNYPYRSAKVCNGGFIVAPPFQNSGLGVGTLLGSLFIVLASDLGYVASMFNLVYATNTGSIRLWEKLGAFRLANTIPNGGQVKVTKSTAAAVATLRNKEAQKGSSTTESMWTANRVITELAHVNAAGESVFTVDAHQFYCDVVAAAPLFREKLTRSRIGRSKL